MNIFAERLKELRTDKGISQDKLSAELKLSKGVFAKWESGNVDVKASSLILLADYFGVSTDYLLGRKDY